MNTLNFLINIIFTAGYFPFRPLPPVWGLIWVSLITGVLMLLIYRLVSNQEGILKEKQKIQAHIFEIRLFKDNPALIAAAVWGVTRHNMVYMYYSLKPLAVMIVPVILILIQLNFRVGYEALTPKEPFIFKVTLNQWTQNSFPKVEIKTPPELIVETPPLRIPSKHEVSWRLRPLKEGDYFIEIVTAAGKSRKSVNVGGHPAMISPLVKTSKFPDQLFYPAEDALPPESNINAISINYHDRPVNILGFNLHWLIVYFVLSLIFGFGLKGFFKVEI